MIVPDVPPIQDINAELERTLIAAFLREHGYDSQEVLRARKDAQAIKILSEASQYASRLLADHECRAHLVRDLHDSRHEVHPRHDTRGK